MKIKKILGGFLACALAIVGAAQLAFAQAVDINVGASATTGNGTGVLERSTTSIDAGAALPNASDEARMNANVNSRINNDGSAGANAGGSFNTINGNNTLTATTTFSITRSDLISVPATTTDAADVSSSEDFEAYARYAMSADENIVKIESNGSSVSLWYREPAKFLGIIPVKVTAKATVMTNGTVTVEYPWWYDVFVKDGGTPELERNLTMTAGTIARAEGESELSTNAQARLVNALRVGLKEYYDANIDMGTTTDMTAE